MPAEAVLDDRALNRALLARQGLLERRQATPLEMGRAAGGVQAERPLFPSFLDFWAPYADRRELQL